MTRSRLLLIAAAGLAVGHVVGVLVARPLFRPAELLAALCLLAYAVRDDRGAPAWGLSVAAVVLVAGAALTVPAESSDRPGWQVLSPEQYPGLVRRAWLEHLTVLLFVLALLVVAVRRRRAGGPATSRVVIGSGIAVALLIIGYVALRATVLLSGAPRQSMATSLGVAVLIPVLLALAALALAVVTVAHRQWRAAAGAVLFVAVSVSWIDAAIGAVPLPYAVRDHADLFALDLIAPTDALPQPTPALTAALQLTAAILAVAGLTRRTPA